MTFSQSARWIVAPTPIMEYNHNDIDCSQLCAYFSVAFNKLGEKLTRKEFMAHTGKIAQPYIMLMTAGEPASDDNYESSLNELLENGWFKASLRFAVLIGKDAINSPKARRTVSRFVTSEEEGIINVDNATNVLLEISGLMWRRGHSSVERERDKSKSELNMNEQIDFMADSGDRFSEYWGDIDWENHKWE